MGTNYAPAKNRTPKERQHTIIKLGPGPARRDYSKHDTLHMMEGLECCWCMCRYCWQPTGRTSSGAARGGCICSSCPCHRPPVSLTVQSDMKRNHK